MDLLLLGDHREGYSMSPEEGGYFAYVAEGVPDGQRYLYQLNGAAKRADPCSLWQSDGVNGPSAVVPTERFQWTDQKWTGIARDQLVFYELHVGAFTPQGTFEAIIPRLHSLKELGITALQLMPVGQFSGTRNWGYDGVFIYAAQNSYGGPHGLQRLVDACHTAGMAIFLDVVYNHVGPEGNYLREFGPYFTNRYQTPWGAAINYDDAGCDAVRDFVLDNARMWLTEFHFDGLRLDAVHAIYDFGARHILRQIAEVADQVRRQTKRQIHIIAESDLNDPRIVRPPEQGGHGLDGQWSDDFHHAIHAYLTGERGGYYLDFGEAQQVAKAVQEPFVYAGQYSPHRRRQHGAPAGDLPGDQFVVCIQNHDQVGNRACGDRLTTILHSPAQQRLAASVLLLAPYLPLLFMGQEYGEENPFPFFCSFDDPQLIEAVRSGRKKEFPQFGQGAEIPDPQSSATFASARLRWSWPGDSWQAGLRQLYQDLLDARRQWPTMQDFANRRARLLGDVKKANIIELVRGAPTEGGGASLQIYCNLTSGVQALTSQSRPALLFSSESPQYQGARTSCDEVRQLMPFEAVVFGPRTWRSYA